MQISPLVVTKRGISMGKVTIKKLSEVIGELSDRPMSFSPSGWLPSAGITRHDSGTIPQTSTDGAPITPPVSGHSQTPTDSPPPGPGNPE